MGDTVTVRASLPIPGAKCTGYGKADNKTYICEVDSAVLSAQRKASQDEEAKRHFELSKGTGLQPRSPVQELADLCSGEWASRSACKR